MKSWIHFGARLISNQHGSAIIFHFVYFSDLDNGHMSISSGMGFIEGFIRLMSHIFGSLFKFFIQSKTYISSSGFDFF